MNIGTTTIIANTTQMELEIFFLITTKTPQYIHTGGIVSSALLIDELLTYQNGLCIDTKRSREINVMFKMEIVKKTVFISLDILCSSTSVSRDINNSPSK